MVPFLGEMGMQTTQQGPVMVPLMGRKGEKWYHLFALSTNPRENGTIKPIAEMVPFPNMTRRHRILPEEITPVMTAIHSQLSTMHHSDPDTMPLFRVLWRLKTHREGRPSYPELDEKTLDKLLAEVELLLVDLNSLVLS